MLLRSKGEVMKSAKPICKPHLQQSPNSIAYHSFFSSDSVYPLVDVGQLAQIHGSLSKFCCFTTKLMSYQLSEPYNQWKRQGSSLFREIIRQYPVLKWSAYISIVHYVSTMPLLIFHKCVVGGRLCLCRLTLELSASLEHSRQSTITPRARACESVRVSSTVGERRCFRNHYLTQTKCRDRYRLLSQRRRYLSSFLHAHPL